VLEHRSAVGNEGCSVSARVASGETVFRRLRRAGPWLLRYYDTEVAVDGVARLVQKTKKLAEVGSGCLTKTAARQGTGRDCSC
jgi:hypothetical protein